MMASLLPISAETGLRQVENSAIVSVVENVEKKRKPQCKYTDSDRYKIARYASQHGPCRAAAHYKKIYPTIRVSTVREFLKKYIKQLDAAKRSNTSPEKRIVNLERGRPLMVGVSIDEKVRKFLMALHRKGGHVSRSIATTAAKVLLKRSEDNSLRNLNVTAASWGKSLLHRMGLRRRVVTTGKVQIPEGAKREAGLQHHYRIATIAEKYNIPPSLILNSDQTPSKYVTVGRTTMAPKNSNRVGLAGSDDKRSITLTLTVTLDGKILPFQIIYGGKTKQSLPKVTFPE